MTKEELDRVKFTPGSLGEVLEALDVDRAYLTESGVFSDRLINLWIEEKRKEIAKSEFISLLLLTMKCITTHEKEI